MSILSLQQYVETYKRSHPHDVVKKKAVESVGIWSRVGVLFTLIAVNILSASHTIPVMLDTVNAQDNWLKVVIAVSAFIGIEFTMLMFMIFGEAGWLRTLVVGGALSVAIIANLSSTMANVGASTYGAGAPIVGVILGLFAPLANLGIGEVYRNMQDRVKDENEDNEEEFKNALNAWDTKVRRLYTAYLTTQGITDKTAQLEYMSGTVPTSEPQALPPPTVNRPTVAGKIKTAKRNAGPTKGVGNLVEMIVRDGMENATYAEIQEKYGVSATSVSAAKRALSGMPQNRA